MATELPTVSEPERAERCETCKWWALQLQANHVEFTEDVGICRRYPPVPKPLELRKIATAALFANDCEYPSTFESDFCGEWRAK